MADCMECDEDIDEDCEVCPGCGLEAPVSYLWYREDYEPAIIQAREGDDPVLLANLLFKAYYDAGSLPDPYVMGDVHGELIELYKEHRMYERLIHQYCIDASNYEYGSPADAIAAVDLALELGREDLELYVYQMIDQFNRAYYRREPPEHIIAREKELFEKIDAGELTEIAFPHFDREMWDDFQLQAGKRGQQDG